MVPGGECSDGLTKNPINCFKLGGMKIYKRAFINKHWYVRNTKIRC